MLQVTRLCEAQRSPSRLARHHTHPKKLAAGLWKLRARPAPHRNRSRPFAVCRWNGRLGRQRNEPPIEYIKRRIRFDFPPGNNHRDRGRVGARILERGPKTEPKDLLRILFERSNATATLWTIEIVVVLGSLAFLASAGKMIGHWSMKLALTIGFLVMAGLQRGRFHRGDGAKTGAGRFLSYAEILGSCDFIGMDFARLLKDG